jgi:hypothetical protein
MCAWSSWPYLLTAIWGKKEPARDEIRPGGPFIAICLVGFREVADVDVASHDRAPRPAGRVTVPANVEMAVMTVVPVVVMAVVVVAVVVVAVVVVAVVVMAVVMMTMAMTAAVPAASRRITRGGERGNGQRDGSGSGSQDSTRHFNFSIWAQSDHRPGV